MITYREKEWKTNVFHKRERKKWERLKKNEFNKEREKEMRQGRKENILMFYKHKYFFKWPAHVEPPVRSVELNSSRWAELKPVKEKKTIHLRLYLLRQGGNTF